MSLKCIDFWNVIKYIIVNDRFVICVGLSLLQTCRCDTCKTTIEYSRESWITNIHIENLISTNITIHTFNLTDSKIGIP